MSGGSGGVPRNNGFFRRRAVPTISPTNGLSMPSGRPSFFLRSIYKLKVPSTTSDDSISLSTTSSTISADDSAVVEGAPTETPPVPYDQPEYFLVRQVPGDGSCLFHAIASWLSYLASGQHLSFEYCCNYSDYEKVMNRSLCVSTVMNGTKPLAIPATLKSVSLNVSNTMCAGIIGNSTQCIPSTEGSWPLLYELSKQLRELSVSILQANQTLELEDYEVLNSSQLVEAVAEHYNVTPAEYCTSMLDPQTWGGGPEIVALSNHFQCPIFVYQLGTEGEGMFPMKQFCLELCARFGYPVFADKEPIHILCADGR